ncbi:MAG: hypothetical protein AAFR83_20880, partial [Cyanobacteria bacterium J06629_18]
MNTEKKVFICNVCSNEAKTKVSAIKHYEKKHMNQSKCKICTHNVKSPMYHSRKHMSTVFKCKFCPNDKYYSTTDLLHQHYTNSHQTPDSNHFSVIDSAFRRRVLTFQSKFKFREVENLDVLKLKVFDDIKSLVRHQLQLKHLMRFSLIVAGEYIKYDELGKVSTDAVVFLRSSSKAVLLNDLNTNQIDKRTNECLTEIFERNENFTLSGSGWSMNQVLHINIEIAKLSFAGGCANTNLKNLKGSKLKCLANPHTLNNECFTNCVALSFLPA